MTIAAKTKDQCLDDGIFAGNPVKETKQEKTDAKCDHQSASQRFNQGYRQRRDRECGFVLHGDGGDCDYEVSDPESRTSRCCQHKQFLWEFSRSLRFALTYGPGLHDCFLIPTRQGWLPLQMI